MDIRVTPRPDAMNSRVDDLDAPQAQPAASWGAIFAGAVVAIAMSLVLVTLGLGLGLASISPWSNHGIGAGTFTVAAAIWLIVTQWVSSIFGGYITGRLRTRWIGTHEHEIFFRDTAHGFVMWALATVVVASLVGSSVWSGIGAGAQAVRSSSASSALAYGLDKLFRPSSVTAAGAGVTAAGDLGTNDSRAEASRILVYDLPSGAVSEADRAYLVSLVASRTGVTDADAEKRVSELVNSINAADAKVKAEADAARKDGVEIAIYSALSLLIGAFIASVAAALGGRLRDLG